MSAPWRAISLGALVVFGTLPGAQEPREAGTPRAPSMILRCQPGMLMLQDGTLVADRNPIARALERAQPGALVQLAAGDYPGFTIGFSSQAPNNARARGGRPDSPVVIEGSGVVRIVPGKLGDTIAIDQKVANAHITFRNLTIVPGKRSAVMFYAQNGPTHAGYSFEDCHILGTWDHTTGNGEESKWGLWGNSLRDFRFVGVRAPARVERIQKEHGFYIQNSRGEILIENVVAERLGRTFCQFTARAREGPPTRGQITVRGCRVSDVGLSPLDGFKGGSAFTVAGRVQGTLLFDGNVYSAGFDPELARLKLRGSPYGTGAFVAWQGGESQVNGTVVLRDNTFQFAPGCGDRPVVAIGGCEKVLFLGRNTIRSGGAHPALAFDPLNDNGKLQSSPNRSVFVANGTVVEGLVTVRSRKPTEEELAALREMGPLPKPGQKSPR